jgi:hypothetical protein
MRLIPFLEPRPPLEKGKQRQITIDSSADTHKAWAEATREVAKVVLHHVYVIHLKNDTDDSYVLFRVDEFEQHKRCTVSWRHLDALKLSNRSFYKAAAEALSAALLPLHGVKKLGMAQFLGANIGGIR